MTEMVERVARAALLPDDAKDHWRAVARAAIEAMREPTEEMIDWGNLNHPDKKGLWQNLIDVALGK